MGEIERPVPGPCDVTGTGHRLYTSILILGQQPDGPNNVRAAPEQSHPQGGSEQTRQHQQESVHAALRQVGCD